MGRRHCPLGGYSTPNDSSVKWASAPGAYVHGDLPRLSHSRLCEVAFWHFSEVRRCPLFRRSWGLSGHESASRLMSTRPSPEVRRWVEPCGPIAVPRTAGSGALPPFTGTGAKDPLPPSRAIPGPRQQIVSRPPSGHSGRPRHAVSQVVRRLPLRWVLRRHRSARRPDRPAAPGPRQADIRSSTSCCAACRPAPGRAPPRAI